MARPTAIDISRREKIIFVTYGLFAGLFSVFILGYLAALLAQFLVLHLQGTGFAIFVGIIMIAFHKKLQSLSLRLRKHLSGGAMSGKPWRNYALPILLIVLLSVVEIELTVSGEFEIYPAHNADIRAEVEAIIDDVYVHEGDRVRKGDRLVHLSDREYRMRLHKIEAEIREYQAKLKILTAGATKEEIDSARSKVDTAKTRYKHALKADQEAEQIHLRHLSKVKGAIDKVREQLNFAVKKLQRIEALSDKRVIPQVTLEQVQEEVSVKRNELREAEAELSMVQAYRHADVVKELAVSRDEVEQAEADLRQLLAGHREEEIESLEAVINALQVQQRYLQDNLQRVKVTSPIEGVVTTPKINEKKANWSKKAI
nr:biotin/lipoyl-binding protein [Methylomarinum sp. Ch1-1]MDP4522818.1 biotin/lipoyl-binding protein [Methylomarinum sp. Ch1-1]